MQSKAYERWFNSYKVIGMRESKQIILSVAVCLFGFATIAIGAEVSTYWSQYVEAKSVGTETILPDFSYAGYRHGEAPIPTVAWTVFDVTDYGAAPDDGLSDKAAIQAAIDAAEVNGSGIVFFPSGRFCINGPEESSPWVNNPITVNGSNVVFRGSGSWSGGTELYGERHMNLTNEAQLWTAPHMIHFDGPGSRSGTTSNVVGDSVRETHSITVTDASVFEAGDWVLLNRVDKSSDAVSEAVAPFAVDSRWTSLINNGVLVDELHLIDSIDGNEIRFKEPIHSTVKADGEWSVILFDPIVEVGVEDIAFVGNWTASFVHHSVYLDDDGKNVSHDSAWSAVSFTDVVNSWIRNCRFTSWNAAMKVGRSSNVSVVHIKLDGNPGHNTLSFNNSSHCFGGLIEDEANQWHACGVSGKASGNVLWKSDYSADTCFESHASQPRHTLFDNISGGWRYGRMGGASNNLPNHLENLVLWNYDNTGAGESGDFEFMRSGSAFFKVIMPYVIGFHGNSQAFDESMVAALESNGAAVAPASLFEAQYKLRTGSSFAQLLFAEWIARFGLSDPENALTADPDNDRRINLVEYALGSEPALGDDSARNGNSYAFAGLDENPGLEMSYTRWRNAGKRGLSYSIERSYDLLAESWLELTSGDAEILDDAFESVSIQVPADIGGKVYLRLKVGVQE